MKIFIKNLDKEFSFSPSSAAAILEKSALPDKNRFLAARFNQTLVDWNEELDQDGQIEFLDFSSEEARDVFRHTSSHIMAQAVLRLFPEARLAIGPSIRDGFYYDFDVPRNFQDGDLAKIESEMAKIIREDLPVTRRVLSRSEATDLFTKRKEPYKVELIRGFPEGNINLYSQGDFSDICRGPHLRSTGRVGVIKLIKISGAYWRGDEKNKMLQRIYGVSFETPEQLEEHLKFLKESEERDHRKLGRELDIYSIQEETGPGLIFWHPAGGLIRHQIETFWKEEHLKNGYQLVYTPHIAKIGLWKISGHLENYRENMYSPMEIDGQEYIIKPMNCPGHILMFKNRLRSYRELPVRWAELGTVYRYERSGVLHGLLRVRGFTQDDAHIFCAEEGLSEEIGSVLGFVFFMLDQFGFKKYRTVLSTKPEKNAVGSDASWEKSTAALRQALENRSIPFELDPGGGVFYGPKISIELIDALGRNWQGPTIQVDFNLPERFDMSYIGADGKEHRPVMIHRALLGSFERFLGILIEHYKGAFPLWLAPVQAVLINITDGQTAYIKNIEKILKENNIRVEADLRNEKMGNKVKDALSRKVPYLFVCGKNEERDKTVSVRSYRDGQLGSHDLGEFISRMRAEIGQRK